MTNIFRSTLCSLMNRLSSADVSNQSICWFAIACLLFVHTHFLSTLLWQRHLHSFIIVYSCFSCCKFVNILDSIIFTMVVILFTTSQLFLLLLFSQDRSPTAKKTKKYIPVNLSHLLRHLLVFFAVGLLSWENSNKRTTWPVVSKMMTIRKMMLSSMFTILQHDKQKSKLYYLVLKLIIFGHKPRIYLLRKTVKAASWFNRLISIEESIFPWSWFAET